MTCEHCCFSCTGKGSFMSQAVFDKCLSIASNYDMDVTLGGGEPTLHPKFLDWTMQAVFATMEASLSNESPAVLVITNGKKTEIAIKLAKMAHLGIIAADVSQDPWHDPIDPKVVKEFNRYKNRYQGDSSPSRGYAGTRNVESGVTARGRAIENDLSSRDQCACDALFIAPNGDFYQCGCKKTKLGNILTDEIPQSFWDAQGECECDIAKKELTPA